SCCTPAPLGPEPAVARACSATICCRAPDEERRHLGSIRRDPQTIRTKDIAVLKKFANQIVDFLRREDGPTAVEYAVMLALIIVVCITAITALGSNSSATFSAVSDQTKSAGS